LVWCCLAFQRRNQQTVVIGAMSPYPAPYGQPAAYGQQAPNPYGQQAPNPYGQQAPNPYLHPNGDPYGLSPTNPYAQPAPNPYGQYPTQDGRIVKP
jgi:hypothetical protein